MDAKTANHTPVSGEFKEQLHSLTLKISMGVSSKPEQVRNMAIVLVIRYLKRKHICRSSWHVT